MAKGSKIYKTPQTWGRVWVVLRERHLSFEVAAVVKRIWVENEKCNGPVENVVFAKLPQRSASDYDADSIKQLTSTLTHFSCDSALYSLRRIRSAEPAMVIKIVDRRL